MGLCSKSKIEIFNYFEFILNKSSLSLIKINLKEEIDENKKNNYIFISSLIDYYQSLQNISNINKKYSYIKLSLKTKNISAFHTLKKEKELFICWIQLLYNNKNNKNTFFDNDKISKNYIKTEIMKNLKNNRLLNIFIDNFNYYYDIPDNKPLIKLILSGMPDFLRPLIWLIILEKKNKTIEKKSFNEYLKQNYNNHYSNQISKDINRTFISYNEDSISLLDEIDEEKINKLKNLLIAISNYNSEIGYTQGMNNIIGFLLKVTKFNEEKTFNLAILILNEIKGYFTKDFPLLKNNLIKFNNEFIKRNPKLYKHFKNNEILDELWISKWMQTLFTISLPYEELCRIWDSLIIFGFDFVIYLSLAIISYAEDELLQLNDLLDIINHLTEIMNPNQIIKRLINYYHNYTEYIIPIDKIISKAQKIKKEIYSEESISNSLNGNNQFINLFNNKDLNINNNKNYSSNPIYRNYLSNSNIITKTNDIKSVKSYCSEINISKNNDNSSYNNNLEKKNINEKLIEVNKQKNNKIKNIDLSGYKNKNIQNIKTNKYSKIECNLINNKNTVYQNYIKNLKINQKCKIKNDKAHKNMKIIIFKNNNNHLIKPLNNDNIIKNRRININKSPSSSPSQYNYPIQKYHVSLDNLNKRKKDIRKGSMNSYIFKDNNYIMNIKRNGSFKISYPVIFYNRYLN